MADQKSGGKKKDRGGEHAAIGQIRDEQRQEKDDGKMSIAVTGRSYHDNRKEAAARYRER